MLKFFRKYILNKVFLVIVGVGLMIIFLLEGTLSNLMRGAAAFPVGTLNGEELTTMDLQQAGGELGVLRSLPVVNVMTDQLVGAQEAETKYLLMLHDAEQMGLSASMQQVAMVEQMLGLDERQMQQLSARFRVAPSAIRAVIRNFIVLQEYSDLVQGNVHRPVQLKLEAANQLMQAIQQNDYMGAFQAQAQLAPMPRVSEPLLAQYVQQQGAVLGASLVLIDAARFVDEATQPSDAELQDLFEQYRANLPGQSEPFGFGYQQPAQVKLRYLAIPMQEAMQQVSVTEAEALEFYDQNRERLEQALGQAREYSAIRSDLINLIKRNKAAELIGRMVRAAEGLFFENTRALAEAGGYREVSDDFEPLPMRVVAEQLESQFGVRPQVLDYTDSWVPVSDLRSLPGIGQAAVQNRPEATLTEYVRSAREFGDIAEEDPAANLRTLRLQEQVVGLPLVGPDGSAYLLRLVDAQPRHTPQSLDEVRGQVVRDARLRAAFERLVAQQEQFVSTAREQGLDALAQEVGGTVTNVPPDLTRREYDPQTRELVVPAISGVGRSEALVQQLFRVAESAAQDGSLQGVPADQRIGEAAVPSELALAVFRVDQYRPISRSRFTQQARSPFLPAELDQVLLRSTEDALDIDNLAVRVGFVAERGSSETSDSAAPGDVE